MSPRFAHNPAEWFVEVVPLRPVDRIEDDEGYKRMGPLTERSAEMVMRGVLINLNRDRYFVRTVRDAPVSRDAA